METPRENGHEGKPRETEEFPIEPAPGEEVPAEEEALSAEVEEELSGVDPPGGEESLDAGALDAEDSDTAEELGGGLLVSLREEAARLHEEARQRQEAAAGLREEARRLREEAEALQAQPAVLYEELVAIREEARAYSERSQAEPDQEIGTADQLEGIEPDAGLAPDAEQDPLGPDEAAEEPLEEPIELEPEIPTDPGEVIQEEPAPRRRRWRFR